MVIATNTTSSEELKPATDSLESKSKTQQKAVTPNADQESWQALGHYAVGEVSIGRIENAMQAYRLLTVLEENETRWKLGKAFCALELNSLDEAREALESVSIADINKEQAKLSGQQKLFQRCQLLLQSMQTQTVDKKQNNQAYEKNNISSQGSSEKVIPFPNANKL